MFGARHASHARNHGHQNGERDHPLYGRIEAADHGGPINPLKRFTISQMMRRRALDTRGANRSISKPDGENTVAVVEYACVGVIGGYRLT